MNFKSDIHSGKAELEEIIILVNNFNTLLHITFLQHTRHFLTQYILSIHGEHMKYLLYTVLLLMTSNTFAIEMLQAIEGQSQMAIIKVQNIKYDIKEQPTMATCFSLGSLKSTLSDLTTLSLNLKDEFDNGKKVFKNAGQAKVLADSTIGFCTKDASNSYSGNGITIEKVKYQNIKSLKKRLNSIETKVNETDDIIRNEL